ncbi:hypothetical protein V6679_22400 [Nocardia testacea]
MDTERAGGAPAIAIVGRMRGQGVQQVGRIVPPVSPSRAGGVAVPHEFRTGPVPRAEHTFISVKTVTDGEPHHNEAVAPPVDGHTSGRLPIRISIY